MISWTEIEMFLRERQASCSNDAWRNENDARTYVGRRTISVHLRDGSTCILI